MAFGPVPSRRLGRSLGINNIPPKSCTYSCVYCQIGRTPRMLVEREPFYLAEEILQDVEARVKEARAQGEPVDYLTFVADGEPSLDIKLGKTIKLLRPLDIKIAIISNGSLLWKDDVQEDLQGSDWVSLKIDATSEHLWRTINRPHGSLRLDTILAGISDFSRAFTGELTTETMLVHGTNDDPAELEKVAGFIARLKPERSYVAVPTRPPAEDWVRPATEHAVNTAYQLFREHSLNVEYLIGYEGNAFAFTGNLAEDLLSITSVHPMREDAVNELLSKANASWAAVETLINDGKLVETTFKGSRFYVRKMSA
ncbi:MAG: radical SAM protein [Chloroflexi bacterium]|nr:radical SAM protein [Chloroflexota bacterium]